MKACKKCNNQKPLEDFVKKSKSKDGYGVYCKQCEYEWNKKSYHRTSGKRNKYLVERRRRLAKERDELIRSLNLKCKICGFDHPAALDFHHIDPKEKFKTGICGSKCSRWPCKLWLNSNSSWLLPS
jgi:hypothetical protein